MTQVGSRNTNYEFIYLKELIVLNKIKYRRHGILIVSLNEYIFKYYINMIFKYLQFEENKLSIALVS